VKDKVTSCISLAKQATQRPQHRTCQSGCTDGALISCKMDSLVRDVVGNLVITVSVHGMVMLKGAQRTFAALVGEVMNGEDMAVYRGLH
jgi:hypothetical protein